MLKRISGAVFRAFIVIVIIAMPSFILPETTLNGRELALIVGGVVAAFTIFEYAARSPGFVDFRFAPPYNRMRVAVFAGQLAVIAFYFRYLGQGGDVQALAEKLRFLQTTPGSPVNLTLTLFADRLTPGQLERLGAALSLGLTTAMVLAMVFALLLTVSRWPVDRAGFNLWINMPNFEPRDVGRTERRLFWDAIANFLMAPIVLFGVPFALPLVTESLGVSLLVDPHSLVWAVALWGFLPAGLIIRGAAILKIARILKSAKGL